MSLLATIGASSKPASGGGGPTETTVYALSTDGQIRSGGSSSYSSARTGLGLVVVTSGIVGQAEDAFDGSEYYVYEAFLNFDLLGAGISPGSDISAAALSVFTKGRPFTDFTLQSRAKDWGDALTTADWVAGANLAAQTLLATISTAGMSNDNRYTLTESGSALRDAIIAALAGDGILRMMLCSDRTVANQTPGVGGQEMLVIGQAESVGTTEDPMLVVTWT